MPVANPEELSVEQNQKQLQRILHSNALRNSLTLQQLLQFLVARSMDGNPENIKEYTIGVEAFGRKPDFDPKTDTIVRVQTHRLRQKLKEYYEQEGIHDPIVVEIPKGHYCPTFRFRSHDAKNRDSENDELADLSTAEAGANSLPASGIELANGIPGKEAAGKRFGSSFSAPVVLALLFVLTLGVGFFAGSYRVRSISSGTTGASGSALSNQQNDPVRSFWTAFLNKDPNPIIAYANAVFLLDDSNDLFRFRQGASDNRGARVDPHLARQFASNPALVASAGQLYYEDGYTGTGELESVAMLTGLFSQMGMKPIIKTSRNITPDDLQQHTVILLGSPFQNIAVAQLLASGDFAYRNPDSRREQWRAEITNAHPEANESPAYHTERDPDTQVLKRDYSLISIQPGVVEGHHIAVIGGLDTKGTEGATRFLISNSGIEKLTAALAAKGLSIDGKSPGKDAMPSFQALVLVHLEKGDQVLSTELEAVHPLLPKKSPENGTDNASAPQKK